MIVKISNFPPIVRPQTNVNMADVVYEVEAEGGVTRFAAIYRSQLPDLVGSVRSARLLDLELVPMYQALLAYSGTSEPIQRLILSSSRMSIKRSRRSRATTRTPGSFASRRKARRSSIRCSLSRPS
ncbi:MAG: DUF3048 domain-containing protein [Chloroflexi bacterium]|nr:DUF3048 domain-containing protein [Chloroflexota bacterium]